MDVARFFSSAKNFFREDTNEFVGAYFDGEKIFLARLTETFESAEISADGDDFARLAGKISEACRLRNWETQAVGFCLRDDDAVTFQTEITNVPEKDLPSFVKSWSQAQSGVGALNSFTKVGVKVWMETLPKSTADEILTAFQNCGLNLLALSIMPPDLLTKKFSPNKAKFICEVAAKKITPNLLRPREKSWDARKLSVVPIAIFLIMEFVFLVNFFSDWRAASNELDAEKISFGDMRDDLNVKKIIDDDATELRRLNNLTANAAAPQNFNVLINLGKTFGGDVRLTKIRVDENFAQLDGRAKSAEAVKSCLARVKNFVTQSARPGNSTVRDDGEIDFTIRADLQKN